MHIAGADGVAIALTPLGWEFPSVAGDEDDPWLVVRGQVDLPDKGWSFEDPCLEMEEARELAKWLRDAGEGRINPIPDREGDGPEPMLSFLEPALGFSIVSRGENERDIRVFFTAEGAPPWLRDRDPHRARFVTSVRVRADQLLAAADDWDEELNLLPSRPRPEQD